MINVDFHILTEPSIITCGKYICRLVETVFRNKHQVYIYVESQKIAQYFNDLLWTFSDTSFVPHNIYEENIENPVSIQIGCISDPKGHNDILINLTENTLPSYANFKKISEIIPNDSVLKTAGRKKYKFYQANKCILKVYE